MDFYGMKYTEILCREKGEQYREIVERIKPDILIEDDCKSIGGQKEWCIMCDWRVLSRRLYRMSKEINVREKISHSELINIYDDFLNEEYFLENVYAVIKDKEVDVVLSDAG